MSGGAIYADSSFISFEYCEFRDNHAVLRGVVSLLHSVMLTDLWIVLVIIIFVTKMVAFHTVNILKCHSRIHILEEIKQTTMEVLYI